MLFPEFLPEVFHRVEFRGIGWQEHQPYVVRNMELSAPVPTGSVQNKKNVFLLMALSQFLQEDLHAGTVHVRQDQGIQRSVVRRKGHIGVGELLEDLDRHEGPQGKGRPTTSGIPDETEPGFVLKHQSQGPVGHRKQDSLVNYDFGEAFFLKSP